MSVRIVLAVAGVALLAGFGFATPAVAHAMVQPPPDVANYALTAGRLWSVVGALVGVVGVVMGGLALARSAGRPDSRRRRAVMGLAAGLAGTVIGGVIVATAEGGPGTGAGIVGGYVALVVGLAGVALGGLALVRRTG